VPDNGGRAMSNHKGHQLRRGGFRRYY